MIIQRTERMVVSRYCTGRLPNAIDLKTIIIITPTNPTFIAQNVTCISFIFFFNSFDLIFFVSFDISFLSYSFHFFFLVPRNVSLLRDKEYPNCPNLTFSPPRKEISFANMNNIKRQMKSHLHPNPLARYQFY